MYGIERAVQSVNLQLGSLRRSPCRAYCSELGAEWALPNPAVEARVIAVANLPVSHHTAVLQQRFHQPVNFFCYPAGKFNATTVRATRQAGYLGATTELPGEASRERMFELHRIRVEGSDGVSGLREKLRQAGA